MMDISDDHRKLCAACTRAITALYQKSASEPNSKIKIATDLELVISQQTGKPIFIKKMQIRYDKTDVRALFLNYQDRFEIYVADGFDTESLRYYKIRELFHIVVDKPEFHTSDLIGHIDNMLLRSPPEGVASTLGHPVIAEHLSQAAATEFLFPHSDRVALRKADGNVDYDKIASDYGIPKWLIERAMTEAYMAEWAPYFGI